jgi:hypothetical protein
MSSPSPLIDVFIQLLDLLTEAINGLTTFVGSPLGALVIAIGVFLVDAGLFAANLVMDIICG